MTELFDALAKYWPVLTGFILVVIWLVRQEGRTTNLEKRFEEMRESSIASFEAHKESVSNEIHSHKDKIAEDIFRVEKNLERSIASVDKKVDSLQVKHDSLDSKVVEQLSDVRESLARIEGALGVQKKNNN